IGLSPTQQQHHGSNSHRSSRIALFVYGLSNKKMSEEDCSNSVEEKKYTVTTERCGTINFYVQGDLDQAQKKAVFLTVHDLGSNHTVFHHFIDHPSMAEMKVRSVFIHVDVPGQGDHAPNFPEDYEFPTMQTIAEDLVEILDHLKVSLVVGLGDGAGANILARFGMAHPTRCLGLVLVHATATTAGVMEHFKDKIVSWKLGNIGMNPTAEQYLVFHKFGGQLESAENKEKLIQEYTNKLKTNINPRNLRRYVHAFQNRSDISGLLEKKLKVETLLVTGSNASHQSTVHAMIGKMDKGHSSLLKIDGVGDVVTEAPDKFAQSLLLFCKGLGLLTSLTMPGVGHRMSGGDADALRLGQRRRTISMEEYDKPNIRRLSITAMQAPPK
uniref:AB hydrolase-1 domain-containing protein n=1 Tax=Strigamia maritima TaxID=126957 RepID=T1JG56_STRMM